MGLFRRLFGPKRPTNASPSPTKEKRRWSFVRSANSASNSVSNAASSYEDGGTMDPNKHAIAVAAATAAVAEAALAAAHAAAEVVRLTSGGTSNGNRSASPAGATSTSSAVYLSRRRRVEETSAAIIQSAFRGYLARRALRALKALVKLQALVRGHIVRKQTADMLRRMQTLVRVQARARANRNHFAKSLHSSFHSFHHRYPRFSSDGETAGFEKRKAGSSRLDQWREDSLWSRPKQDDDRSDKILEVDTWEPNMKSISKLSSNVGNLSSNFVDEGFQRGAESSVSASSRPSSSHGRCPFTPTRSESSWGVFNGYPGHPNYMSNTESSRAKVRSQSAPRQRMELERYGAGKRSYYDGDWTSERMLERNNDFKPRLFPTSGGYNTISR